MNEIAVSIIVPTYNRSELLSCCLQSILKANFPENFKLELIVVDNNSTDRTSDVVRGFSEEIEYHSIKYLFEPRQGKSNAVNAGLLEAVNDIICLIDDDVCLSPDWFVVLERLLRNRGSEFDYLGGKILPRWESEDKPLPHWIEPLKEGVIVWRDYGDSEWRYEPTSPMLVGAACVFKRSVFTDIGMLEPSLGPSGTSLINSEDSLFFTLLNKHAKVGYYIPDLVVFHFVPNYRLTKSYFRHWSFAGGISESILDELTADDEIPRVLGVPRWRYKTAFFSFWKKLLAMVQFNSADALKFENPILVFAGYFYVRNLKHSPLDKLLKLIAMVLFKPSHRI